MRTVKAKEGINYDWVWDYAKEQWGYRVGSFESLETKADDIIKYLGGGTGLFAIGVLAKVDSSTVWIALATLPAVMLALFSLYYAVKAKRPDFAPSLPGIDNAKEYADGSKEAKVAFLGQWHAACTDMKLVCRWKAGLVEKSIRFFWLAVTFLLLPLLVGIVHPPSSKTTEHSYPSEISIEGGNVKIGMKTKS
jgi:hypothetical protein